MSEREAFLRRFHAARPGITARAFSRGGSYAALARRVPRAARVLDLACGDGALLALLGPRAIGVDLSREELAGAPGVGPTSRHPRLVQGRAEALPFADASIEVVTCHLAFMLFDRIEAVAGEVARVLVPGGRLVALLGGGPTAAGDDAFHRFLRELGARSSTRPPRFGDPRARTEEGWRALFAGWEVPAFERWELDLGGSFEQVWRFLGASYELPVGAEEVVRARLERATADLAGPGGRIPCRVVTWLAQATAPGLA